MYLLIGLVKHVEGTLKVWKWRVFKVVNIFAHDLSVGNQVSLAIQHVRYHHYLIDRGIGELERKLSGLNIEGENLWGRTVLQFFLVLKLEHITRLKRQGIPIGNSDVHINGAANVVRNIILPNVFNVLCVISTFVAFLLVIILFVSVGSFKACLMVGP
jgi:hypothetical protein